MIETSSHHSVFQGTIGIPGLDHMLGGWRRGGLYLVVGNEIAPLRQLLAQIVLHNLDESPACLLTTTPPDAWLDEGSMSRLVEAAQNQRLSVWLPTGDGKPTEDMQALMHDLAGALPEPSGLLIWHDPASLLRPLKDEISRRLATLRTYLIEQGHVCLMAVDPLSVPLEEGFGLLAEWRDQLTGLARVGRDTLEIAHWHTPEGTLCQQRYRLQFDHDLISLRESPLTTSEGPAPVPPLSGSRNHLATGRSMGDMAILPRGWSILPDAEALLEAVDPSLTAGVWLHYDQQTPLPILEQQTRSLRMRLGRTIPLMIVERGIRLRHGQGVRLLKQGATQILPDVPAHALIRIGEACDRLQIMHPEGAILPDSPLFEETAKGYLPPPAFAKQVHEIVIRNAEIGIQSALIRLAPLPGFSLA